METLAQGADRCQSHPETPAALTCARCGSFVCEACRSTTVAGHCAACAERLSRSRFVAHVEPLAIALIVHGVLSAGTGLYYLVFGTFFAHGLSTTTPAPEAEAHPLDELLPGMMLGAFGLLALVQLLPGVLQVGAGLLARRYRGWALTLVALGAGLLTVFGCYCGPSSVALFVWGVLVLRDADVRARFAASSAM